MTDAQLETLVQALLYEGYLLYPYRPSAQKNRQRWTLGMLHPQAWTEGRASGERSRAQCQLLITGSESSWLSLSFRFLHLFARRDRPHPEWREGCERSVHARVTLGEATGTGVRGQFSFHGISDVADAEIQGVAAEWECRADRLSPGVYRLTLSLVNRTPLPPEASTEEAEARGLASAHLVLRSDAMFASAIDPPEAWRCHLEPQANQGWFPVLIDSAGMLCSPIILSDHPRVADESPSDLFDGAEIDEILSLRILTLTDGEKEEVRRADPRARRLLARVEALTHEQRLRLHGAVRSAP